MAQITWKKGGTADVVASADDLTTVRSTIPSAPGSRIEGELEGGAAVRLKVHRCKKAGDAFVLEGRLLDASRELRTKLAELSPKA